MYKIWEYLTGYFHNFKCSTFHFYKLSDVSWLQSSQPLEKYCIKDEIQSNSFIALPSLFSGHEHFWTIMFHSKCVVSAHYQFFIIILKSCDKIFLLCYSTELAYQPDTSHHNNPSVALPLPVPSLRIPTRITRIKAGNQKIATDILRAHLTSPVVTRDVKIFTVKCLTK